MMRMWTWDWEFCLVSDNYFYEPKNGRAKSRLQNLQNLAENILKQKGISFCGKKGYCCTFFIDKLMLKFLTPPPPLNPSTYFLGHHSPALSLSVRISTRAFQRLKIVWVRPLSAKRLGALTRNFYLFLSLGRHKVWTRTGGQWNGIGGARLAHIFCSGQTACWH